MNQLAEYIKAQTGGAIYRKNPVIERIARETGYSVETVYRAAVGKGEIRTERVRVALAKYKAPTRRKRK